MSDRSEGDRKGGEPEAGMLWRLFAIDLRALAALRISLALILLADLLLRSLELGLHYTDGGLMPRELLNPQGRETLVPLHLLSGAAWYEALLFALAAVAALLFGLGYRTRVAGVACWALGLSLYMRNPTISDFGDELLRALLFWSMFLPMGARWSIDARRRTRASPRRDVLSPASAALLLQVFLVYFVTALLKDGPDWRSDFTAIHYALQQDWWVRPVGVWLSSHTSLLELLTLATILFEILGPLLLFVPFQTARLRIALVLAFWVFQAGLGFSLVLHLFPFVNSAMMLAFLPATVWDRVEGWLPGRRGSATPEPQGAAGGGLRAGPRWLDAAVALSLLYVLSINAVSAWPELPFPRPLARAGHFLGLNQEWRMYAPNGPRYDGWYVIPGTLRNGRVVNLWHTGPELDWEKPQRISRHHLSARFASYELTLSRPAYDEPGYRVYRERYAAWLCQRWNREHEGPERLESLEVWFMQEPTAPPGVEPVVQRRLLIRHACGPEVR